MIPETELTPSIRQHINEVITGREPDPDPQVKDLDDKFVRLAFQMEEEEQANLVRLYVHHIAGVNIERPDWAHQAGRNLNGVVGEIPPQNEVNFWQELFHSIPELFSAEEQKWLIENDPHAGGAFNILCYMSFWNARSHLVTRLMDMVHYYK